MAKLKKVKKKAGVILTDSEMKKKYYGSGLASDISVVPEDALWLPSRNIYLNYTMGGGIQYGKILEVFGGESSGKSLVAMDFGYCCQYLGGVVLWNDAEQSFDPHWAKVNGLSLDRIVLYNETSIEKISDWAADMAVTWRSRLTHNEPILLVTDSIAALDCEENINSTQSDAKAEMGNRAKAIYKYLRIRNQLFAELGITLIFINQLRKKVGATMFEDPDTTPGGDAMKFYASQRMAFFRKKRIEIESHGHKMWIGNEASVRMKKNKLAPPRPTFDTSIYFSEEEGKVGFGKYDNLIELLERTSVVTRPKGGSRFMFEGNTIANGKEKFQLALETNKELRSKLLRKSGVNTISKSELKLQRLRAKGENRYPIKSTRVSKQQEEPDEEDS
jgi:recombination protein RecA